MKRLLLLLIGVVFFLVFVSCQSTGEQDASKEKTAQSLHLSPEEHLEKIKLELKEVKAELAQAGEYNCCIQPTCNWCALHDGDCECYDNLKAGKRVCPDCGLGWHNGQGVVEGINVSQVKWDISHEH